MYGFRKALQSGRAFGSLGRGRAAQAAHRRASRAALVGRCLPRAQTQTLMPGVTYERAVQFTPHGPVALHVVTGPRPTGLYALRPVLSNETISGTRARHRDAEAALAERHDGRGQRRLLQPRHRPPERRADARRRRRQPAVRRPLERRRRAPTGTLDVRRIEFFGTWKGLGQRRAINDLNQLPGPNGVSLFTSSYGPGDAAAGGRRRRRCIVAVPARDAEHRSRRPGRSRSAAAAARRSRRAAPFSSRAAPRRRGSPRRRRSARPSRCG